MSSINQPKQIPLESTQKLSDPRLNSSFHSNQKDDLFYHPNSRRSNPRYPNPMIKEKREEVINERYLFNLARPRRSMLNYSLCSYCRDELYHDHNKFMVPASKKEVFIRINLCSLCANKNIDYSMEWWEHNKAGNKARLAAIGKMEPVN